MSKFHVTDTFSLEGRRLFVLAGEIVDGDIRAGMVVRVPLDSSISLSEPIHSIEYGLGAGGEEDVCLCIACVDSHELAVWDGLDIGDETLEILASDRD